MAREVMSSVDAAWLHMEDPTNLMMINGFFQFDRPLDFERVRATLEHRLLPFKRFRKRVVEPRLPLRPPYWETDPNFDLDSHLHRIALPAPGDESALVEVVNRLASTPLDYSKPLWQFHVIENFGEGCIFFCRLHHCIADGIALMYVMLSMCDEDADAPWPETKASERRSRGSLTPLGRMLRPAASMVASTRKLTGTLWNEGRELLSSPAHLLERTLDAASYAASLGRMTLLPPDPKTIFKGPLRVSKRTAWTGPLPLDEVKAVGKALDCTINDVLLASVTGALRRYLLGRGETADGIEIRAMVPVNLRPMEQASHLGNSFGLVILSLPIGTPEPLQRLLLVKRRMDDLKQSPDAVVAFAVLYAMGMAPSQVESLGVEFFASKATAVMTNVPGPRQKLYFAGGRIEKLMFWVPQAGRLGIGVSILSYAGEVTVGVITDASLMPDPQTIVAGVHEEFETLKQLVHQVAETAYKGPVQVSPDGERRRCKAITHAGNPCKNRALAGSAYCGIHIRVVADSEDMAAL